MNCRDCLHWHRHYPNDGGVCTAPSSSTRSIEGLNIPMNHADAEGAIGDTMYGIYRNTELRVTHGKLASCNEARGKATPE